MSQRNQQHEEAWEVLALPGTGRSPKPQSESSPHCSPSTQLGNLMAPVKPLREDGTCLYQRFTYSHKTAGSAG